jgi:hypothetical protein
VRDNPQVRVVAPRTIAVGLRSGCDLSGLCHAWEKTW